MVPKLKYSHYGAIWTENKVKIEQILLRKHVDAHMLRLFSTNTVVKPWQPRSVLVEKKWHFNHQNDPPATTNGRDQWQNRSMRSTETATNKEIDNVSQCNGTVRVFLLIITIWLCLLEKMQLDDPENYSAAVDPDGRM